MENQATRDHWNENSDNYYSHQAEKDHPGILQEDPYRAFPEEIAAWLRQLYPDMRGMKILVPSSGDNLAAFAFHLLGAEVTSADLAENQLKNAKAIADARGWDIRFVQADSMSLEGIPSEAYDLVYTSNGAHVWISDLTRMYGSFRRVLKPGGRYIFFETHPFIRPFDDSAAEVRIVKPYHIIRTEDNPLNYHWRVQDFVKGLLAAGFTLRDFAEFYAKPGYFCGHNWYYGSREEAEADNCRLYDWTLNPYAALPQWLGAVVEKG